MLTSMSFKNMINLIQEKPTAEQVKALREKTGLSGSQFADLIGLSNRQLISDYENGKKTPNAQTWTLMLLATNQHPNFKLERTHAMNKLHSLTNATSVNEVVDIINETPATSEHLIAHYGFTKDETTSEYFAAQYAYESALDSKETITDDMLQANLDFIKDEGANFDVKKAFEIAKQFK